MRETFAQYAARLNADERQRLEERAGIMEFSGNIARETAERWAVADHKMEHERATQLACQVLRRGA